MWGKNMMKKTALAFMLMCMTVSGCGVKETTKMEEISFEDIEKTENENDKEEEKNSAKTIVVYVCGQVSEPGVYKLVEGSRIYEAIEAAGGLLENASEDSLNQAALAEDGQQITVLSKEEACAQSSSGGPGLELGLVNINSASKEELMTLTGIGEMKADAILKYREEHGRFSTVEELMNVDGIKESTFSKVQDKIKI